MNIIFITNDPDRHDFYGSCVHGDIGKGLIKDFLYDSKTIKRWVAKDYEASGLDAYTLKPLLLGLGNKNIQYCVDLCTVDISDWDLDDEVKYIGQNLKYDIKLELVHFGWKHRNLYDTMIAEQKIYQGCQTNPLFKYNLEAVTFRQLRKERRHGKVVRNDFIGGNPKTFVFKHKHIEYLAEDLIDLEDIKESQMKKLKQYDLLPWMINVEFPLVYHLARCELNGFDFDTVQWQKNVDESFIKRHDIACELDTEMRRLRDISKSPYVERLRGGVYNKKRNFQPRQLTEGLFGTMSKFDFHNVKHNKGKPKNVKVNKKKKQVKIANTPFNVNWGSDLQILYILACLRIPAPLQGSVGRKFGYLVPSIEPKKRKIIQDEGYKPRNPDKIFRFIKAKGEGYTTGKDALTKYLVDYPNTPIRRLIMLIKQWRECNHEINSFGEKFFSKINPVTGRLHTIYRQANANNARFQSGGGNLQPDKFQSQNIPRKLKFRHCFKGAPDESGVWPEFTTCDLGGAEVCIVCDKSGDKNLKVWAIDQDDTHSPMVQNSWRHIFRFRAGKIAKAWKNPKEYEEQRGSNPILVNHPNSLVQKWFKLSTTFIVSKTVNAAYRQAGKNGTFGGLYGMEPAKAAETFNGTDSELMKLDPNYEPVCVTKEEGIIILMAQKSVIPDAYKYIESNVSKAFSQGYIMYDDRSKSRIWFPAVLALHKVIRQEHLEFYGIRHPEIMYIGDGRYKVFATQCQYRLDRRDAKDIDGKARNIPISGTQADCVKEAIVDICSYIEDNDLPAKFLIQVHDELGFTSPKGMAHVTFTFDKPVEENSLKFDYEIETTENCKVRSVKVPFSQFIRLSMIEAANRHMKTIKMDASFDVMDSWTK